MAPLAELERLYGEPADAWEHAAGAKEAQSASEGTTAAVEQPPHVELAEFQQASAAHRQAAERAQLVASPSDSREGRAGIRAIHRTLPRGAAGMPLVVASLASPGGMHGGAQRGTHGGC